MKNGEGHAKAYSSCFEAVFCFLYFDPDTGFLRARQIFVSVISNVSTIAMAMLFAIFEHIYQKFDTRRMDKFYRYAI